MDAIELIGRLAFVAMFLTSGVRHVSEREGMTAYARAMGGPAPELLVPLSGFMILAGGGLIALGVWADLGALLIAGFLIPTAYYMHGFWRFEDDQMKQNQMAHFMKNMSLAGAAIALFTLYQQFADHLWMLTGPLFG
jgi:putative oxidoreductase